MFPPPNAKFGAENNGDEVSGGEIRVQFFAQNFLKFIEKFFEKSLEKVLTKDLKKYLMVLFPLRGSSLKFTLCD